MERLMRSPPIGWFGSRQTVHPLMGLSLLMAAFFAWYLLLQSYPQNATVAQDELWAATLAPMSFFQALVFILRYDIHPPLYYLQLNLWSTISQSDHWLQLNSLMWLMATAAVVVLLVRRRANQTIAYLAGAYVLSSPYLVFYGFELRMYPMLAFLTILGLWFTEKLIEKPTRGNWIAVFLTYIAASYTHALAPLVIPCHALYGLLHARQRGQSQNFIVRWIASMAVISLVALPVFINSVVRSDNHAAKPDLDTVVSTITQLLVGTPMVAVDLAGMLCLVLLLALIVETLIRSESRYLVLSYFVLPVLALLVMSYALRPVWLARPFLFALPILGVAFGRVALGRAVVRREMGVLLAIIVALQIAIVFREARLPKTPNYAALTAALRPLTQPGDAIVVLKRDEIFWGVARYYAGPRWGDGLRVGVPPSENWTRILTKLPEPVRAYLARTDRFEYQGVQVIGGHPDDLGKFNRVFFVGYPTDPVPPGWRDAPVVLTDADVTAYGPLPEGVR